MSFFTERLNEFVNARGLKPADICRATGFTSSQVTYLLNGRTKDPQLSTVAKLAQSLGMSVDWLAGLTDVEDAVLEFQPAYDPKNTEVSELVDGYLSLPQSGRQSIKEQIELQQLKNGAQSGLQDDSVSEVA